jgi:hypothetical protein
MFIFFECTDGCKEIKFAVKSYSRERARQSKSLTVLQVVLVIHKGK